MGVMYTHVHVHYKILLLVQNNYDNHLGTYVHAYPGEYWYGGRGAQGVRAAPSALA